MPCGPQLLATVGVSFERRKKQWVHLLATAQLFFLIDGFCDAAEPAALHCRFEMEQGSSLTKQQLSKGKMPITKYVYMCS